MALDEGLLRQAHDAAARWTETQQQAELAKNDYHHAVRQLHLAGASLREIAEALDISHQRVHQIVEASGGTAGWKPRRKTGADLRCTFCGASQAEVDKLVAGPAVFICGDCVALAQQVIHEAGSLDASRTHLDPVPPHSALSCSFCDKSAGQVARLVAGPGVRICDQCVNFCVEVIAVQPG